MNFVTCVHFYRTCIFCQPASRQVGLAAQQGVMVERPSVPCSKALILLDQVCCATGLVSLTRQTPVLTSCKLPIGCWKQGYRLCQRLVPVADTRDVHSE